MTLLPAPEQDITPRRDLGVSLSRPDLGGYILPRPCSNPDCEAGAYEWHHIVRRSSTAGPVEWVEIDGYTVGNVVTLCHDCHRDVTGDVGGHKARIWWDGSSFRWTVPDDEDENAWHDAGALDPHPPYHDSGSGVTAAGADTDAASSFPAAPVGSTDTPRPCPRCKGTGKAAESTKSTTERKPRKEPEVHVPVTLNVPKDAEPGELVLHELIEQCREKLADAVDTKRSNYYIVADVLYDWLTGGRASDLEAA